MKKAYLVFKNGKIFEGFSFGAEKDSVGELVFTTSMVGYLETLTDPSYKGQIVIQTFPLIGNYGVIPEDFEGEPALSGYVVGEYSKKPSNFRCEYDLDVFLKEKNIPGIYGIDTRELTKILREEGVLSAGIYQNPPKDFKQLENFTLTDAVESVSSQKVTVYEPIGEEKHSVVLIDYGAKQNIIRSLTKRGCKVTVVPFDTSGEDILSMSPDGVMLSNGPGDPADNVYQIEQIKKLIGKIPIFGICLGHQLTALAMGAKTVKLKYGHRGSNQPVKDLIGGRTFITTQNHGYAVVPKSIPSGAVLKYINANDSSCEGILYPDKKCFTVQFHPEACAGPHDTDFLFDDFITMMEEEKNAQR
ncbi:MAG: carbamoyl phosphate synthase small subunit [Firmicutes bacterium]|nr:carbamoyl phosphate synthase small subunit [Bacillota bacterium]